MKYFQLLFKIYQLLKFSFSDLDERGMFIFVKALNNKRIITKRIDLNSKEIKQLFAFFNKTEKTLKIK